ncbi:MAG: hypothetical protein AAF790_05140 [Planctomycetota bacterium]
MSTSDQIIRAERDARYYTRFWFIAAGAFVFMLLCIYDGAVKWPAQHERFVVYTELSENQRGGEWESVAAERGWPLEPPAKDRSPAEINGQFVFAGICLAVVLALMVFILRSRGRWMQADGAQITTSWGETVAYDAVEEIDKRKWEKKGLAYIRHSTGSDDGGPKRFVLDDFKFVRKPTDAILYQMEQAVGVEKITGGAPEQDLAAKAADAVDGDGSDSAAVAEAT